MTAVLSVTDTRTVTVAALREVADNPHLLEIGYWATVEHGLAHGFARHDDFKLALLAVAAHLGTTETGKAQQ